MAEHNKTNNKEPLGVNDGLEQSGQPSSTFIIDYDRYANALGCDDSNDPKVREIIDIWLNVLLQISAINLGICPTQMACGQASEKPSLPTSSAKHSVKLSDQFLRKEFQKTAIQTAEKESAA